MKNVIYNKFTKFFAMVCILVSVSILLYEVTQIVREEIERNETDREIYNEYMDYEAINYEIYNRLVPYVDVVINAYKEDGMLGIENAFKNDIEMDDYIDVEAVDDEQIFISYYGMKSIDDWLEDWHGYDDSEEYQYVPYQYIDSVYYHDNKDFGCSIYISDEVGCKFFEHGGSYIIDDKFGPILSEEAEQYLATVDSELRICIESDVSLEYEVFAKFDKNYLNALKEYNLGSLEDDMLQRIPMAIAVGIVIIAATLFLIISCGRTAEGKKELNYYERGYSELHLILIVLLGQAIFWGMLYFYGEYDNILFKHIDRDVINGIIIAMAVIGIAWLYYEIGIVIKKLINKRFVKDLLVLRIFYSIKKWLAKITKGIRTEIKLAYNSSAYAALPTIKKQYIKKIIKDIVVGIVAIIAIIMTINLSSILYDYVNLVRKVNEWGYHWEYRAVFVVLYYCIIWIPIIMYYVNSIFEYRNLRNYNKLITAVDTIYDGDYAGVQISDDENNETFKKLANLSHSFEDSVRKQVEAEKMQVELVANVSHDLKTPLTSIISYVDLLKEEEMSDVARDYVKVLVDKSARLKDIVADVFDLAKATSGEQVPMETLDGVVLINQVLSDMSDRIEEAGKDIRTKLQSENAPIKGNGQKLYRVFQNVIDNALKYSMPGTRIYINAETSNGEFVVTVKNISEYEIDFTAEEIMSRFTRGDKSRHSEGNGLGLSIAKSFTELCGGSFEVKLDDDVFMVVIRLR